MIVQRYKEIEKKIAQRSEMKINPHYEHCETFFALKGERARKGSSGGDKKGRRKNYWETFSCMKWWKIISPRSSTFASSRKFGCRLHSNKD